MRHDATGNRPEKEYAGHYKDIYLRDPQGNVMAVYRIRKDSLFLTELPMYGEKRLGVIKENKFLMKKPAGNNVSFGVIKFTNFSLGKQNGKQTIYPLGKKHYESTDRLGNVRVTYTDKKSWQQNKFALNVSSSQDYYPFGSVMEGRKYNLTAYRYAFNTQERVPELNESHYTALYWEYDGRLARRWNVEPMAKNMSYFNALSLYSILFNNPVTFIDVNGLYPIYIVTRSYAPFETFGPGNNWYGDNRWHTLDRKASYRTLVSIQHDTETRKTVAFGGHSRSHTVDGTKDAISYTYVENRSKGENIDVYSYGNNAAQWGAFDIDQFTKLRVNIEGDIKEDHILHISGTISGDDFPNQESFIYDAEGNTLWFGNFETKGDREIGPLWNLPYENENNINIKIDVKILVDSKGIFQGVMVNDGGKDRVISIEEWNKRFEKNEEN